MPSCSSLKFANVPVTSSTRRTPLYSFDVPIDRSSVAGGGGSGSVLATNGQLAQLVADFQTQRTAAASVVDKRSSVVDHHPVAIGHRTAVSQTTSNGDLGVIGASQRHYGGPKVKQPSKTKAKSEKKGDSWHLPTVQRYNEGLLCLINN